MERVAVPMATTAHVMKVGIARIQDPLQRCGSVQLPGVCVTVRRDIELRTHRSAVERWIVERAPNNAHAV